jgi:hypothetical protein
VNPKRRKDNKPAPIPALTTEEAVAALTAPPTDPQPLQKIDRVCTLRLIYDHAAKRWDWYVEGLATFTDNSAQFIHEKREGVVIDPNYRPPLDYPLPSIPERILPSYQAAEAAGK